MKLRFLSVALVLAVLSGAGYVAYTQIRPSADSVSTLVNSSDPALQCPDILPDMPSGSNSESGFLNGNPKFPYSISESWGPGHYERTSKETLMYDDSNTATDDPKYYWTMYENTHIVSVSGPATVHPGQVFSWTSVTTDMTTFPGASEPTRTSTNTTHYTAYGYKTDGSQVVKAPETVWYKGKMSSPLLSDDKYSLTYIVTPSPPRDFTVTSDVPPFSFIGSTAPSVPFTFKSSLPSQLRLITHQAGLAVSPTEFLINDKDTNSAIVNGSSLTPGAVYVSGTAKEGCGGITDAKATGYVYDLKALTENPTLNTSQVSSGGSEADQEIETTELQIGLDGWTQLTTDDERAEFKKYFADKKWKVTLLGRNSDDEKYSLIPGTEAGVKDQARLTESGNDGGVVIPIQTDEWTTEQAGQTLQIRPTKLSIMNDMKLKLEIVGTEAVREIALHVDEQPKLSLQLCHGAIERTALTSRLDWNRDDAGVSSGTSEQLPESCSLGEAFVVGDEQAIIVTPTLQNLAPDASYQLSISFPSAPSGSEGAAYFTVQDAAGGTMREGNGGIATISWPIHTGQDVPKPQITSHNKQTQGAQSAPTVPISSKLEIDKDGLKSEEVSQQVPVEFANLTKNITVETLRHERQNNSGEYRNLAGQNGDGEKDAILPGDRITYHVTIAEPISAGTTLALRLSDYVAVSAGGVGNGIIQPGYFSQENNNKDAIVWTYDSAKSGDSFDFTLSVKPETEIPLNITKLGNSFVLEHKGMRQRTELSLIQDELYALVEGSLTTRFNLTVPQLVIMTETTVSELVNGSLQETIKTESRPYSSQDISRNNNGGYVVTENTGKFKILINRARGITKNETAVLHFRFHNFIDESDEGAWLSLCIGDSVELVTKPLNLNAKNGKYVIDLNLNSSEDVQNIIAEPVALQVIPNISRDELILYALQTWRDAWDIRRWLEKQSSNIDFTNHKLWIAILKEDQSHFDEKSGNIILGAEAEYDIKSSRKKRNPLLLWHEFSHYVDDQLYGSIGFAEGELPHYGYFNSTSVNSNKEGFAIGMASIAKREILGDTSGRYNPFGWVMFDIDDIPIVPVSEVFFRGKDIGTIGIDEQDIETGYGLGYGEQAETRSVAEIMWALIYGRSLPKNPDWVSGSLRPLKSIPPALSIPELLSIWNKNGDRTITSNYANLRASGNISQLDDMFLAMGICADIQVDSITGKTGNWRCDQGEEIGRPANGLEFDMVEGMEKQTILARPDRRSTPPLLPGGFIRINGTGSVVPIHVDVLFDVNRTGQFSEGYNFDMEWPSGETLPVTLPSMPYDGRVIITADGSSQAFVFTSNQYWSVGLRKETAYLANETFMPTENTVRPTTDQVLEGLAQRGMTSGFVDLAVPAKQSIITEPSVIVCASGCLSDEIGGLMPVDPASVTPPTEGENVMSEPLSRLDELTLEEGDTVAQQVQSQIATPLVVRAGATMTLDISNLSSETVALYLDNVEILRTPIIGSNIGLNVPIAKTVTNGSHALLVRGVENGEEITQGILIVDGAEPRSVYFWLSVSGVFVLCVIISLLIRRRIKKRVAA